MAYRCQNLNIFYRQCSLYEPSNYSIFLLLLLLCGREKISFTLEVSVYTQLYTCTLNVTMYPSVNAAHLLHVRYCCCSQSSSLYVPCASTIHFREQRDVLICAGCGTYQAPVPRSPQIGMWMDGHFLCVLNRFSASPPHRTYARSARLILRKLLVLTKIVLLTTNMKKDF